jgi:hypothetical protein
MPTELMPLEKIRRYRERHLITPLSDEKGNFYCTYDLIRVSAGPRGRFRHDASEIQDLVKQEAQTNWP